MGIFDSVYVPCPKCNEPIEFQSKAAYDPYMNQYTLSDAPPEILTDIMNSPLYCACGSWVALIDPRYPPGQKPRPYLTAMRVTAPETPIIHPQGFRSWPHNKPFTWDDLESAPVDRPVAEGE
jgi:hypothetical protein